MGGRGPVPQEKRSRDRDEVPKTDLSGSRGRKYHPFPPRYGPPGEEVACLPGTRRIWETWRTSPQAEAFTATDWLRLEALVPLWDQYLRTGEVKLMAEIRLNEASLGATPADRLRLRWRIDGEGSERGSTPRKTSSRAKGDPRREAS